MPNNSASFLNKIFIYINTVYNISNQESARTKRAISSTHLLCMGAVTQITDLDSTSARCCAVRY